MPPEIDRFGASPSYGRRQDNSLKGSGHFGLLKRPDGQVSTELSAEMDGLEFPLISPALDGIEIQYLLNGGEPTREMYERSYKYALMRKNAGQSPFAEEGEARPHQGLAVMQGWK